MTESLTLSWDVQQIEKMLQMASLKFLLPKWDVDQIQLKPVAAKSTQKTAVEVKKAGNLSAGMLPLSTAL